MGNCCKASVQSPRRDDDRNQQMTNIGTPVPPPPVPIKASTTSVELRDDEVVLARLAAWEAQNFGGRVLDEGEQQELKIFTLADLEVAAKRFCGANRKEPIIQAVSLFHKGLLERETLQPPPPRPQVEDPAAISFVIAIIKKQDPHIAHVFEDCFADWLAEKHLTCRLSHPNILNLLGYCKEESMLLLVYRFGENKSLKEYLRSKEKTLSWTERLQICTQAACGLAFLHTLEEPIGYLPCLRTSKVLLDESLNVKLVGYGLKALKYSRYHIRRSNVDQGIKLGLMTSVAPEYQQKDYKWTQKSDVYGFGIMLIELLTGRVATEDPKLVANALTTIADLSPNMEKVYHPEKKLLKELVDKDIKGQYTTIAAKQMAKLVEVCLRSDPESRPTIPRVYYELQNIQKITKGNHPKPDAAGASSSSAPGCSA